MTGYMYHREEVGGCAQPPGGSTVMGWAEIGSRPHHRHRRVALSWARRRGPRVRCGPRKQDVLFRGALRDGGARSVGGGIGRAAVSGRGRETNPPFRPSPPSPTRRTFLCSISVLYVQRAEPRPVAPRSVAAHPTYVSPAGFCICMPAAHGACSPDWESSPARPVGDMGRVERSLADAARVGGEWRGSARPK